MATDRAPPPRKRTSGCSLSLEAFVWKLMKLVLSGNGAAAMGTREEPVGTGHKAQGTRLSIHTLSS